MRLAVVLAVTVFVAATPAQITAFAQPVGQGCPWVPSFPPSLTTSAPPLLGQTLVLQPGGLSGAVGILWVSPGPPAPPTVLFPGCEVQVDLATVFPFTTFPTGTAGFGWLPIDVPNDPQLLGRELTLQASMTASWQPAGEQPVITPALHVRVGNQ